MIDLTRWESTGTQRRAALISVALIVLGAIAITPFADMPVAASLTAIAMVTGAAVVANAITAFLLFSQYRTTRSSAIAALSVGYAFSAAVMLPYLITYPGMFGRAVPFGAVHHSSSWLWILWHVGFMALLLAYAAARARLERPGRERLAGRLVRIAYRATIPLYLILVASAMWLADRLPPVYEGGHWTMFFTAIVAPIVFALSIATIVVLVRATQLRSMLDLWLAVTIVAMICDIYLTMISGTRFTVAWYAARAEVFVAAVAVLVIFVYQIDRMYGALARTASHLDEQAHIDGLTGIANRRRFDEYSARVVATAQRRNAALSVLIADIDFFKAYNDGFGHLAGDDCLRQVAHIIRSQVPRPGDLVARYGGEEFVAVLVDTDAAGAAIVAERIRHAVEAARIPHAPSTGQPFVTISIGASELRSSDDSLEGMVGAADRTLYRAKHDGRNRIDVAPFSPVTVS